MSIFGWSYPPGAATDPFAPYNQTYEPLSLAKDKTLIGYGKPGHGLNGKDADLDTCGQNVVEEAWWHENDTIEIRGRRYAALVPSEDWSEAQLDVATEIVCGAGIPGEWDGDYWVLSEEYSLTVPCAWTDDETDEQNLDRAKAAAYAAIEKDSEAFETEIAGLNEAFGAL
jgi:hypothetical protein